MKARGEITKNEANELKLNLMGGTEEIQKPKELIV